MRVITWDEKMLQDGCMRLEETARSFGPDLIVAIANGGIPIAQLLFPSTPHCKIECHRQSTAVKSRYSLIWSIIRRLPLKVKDFMRIAEAKLLKRNARSTEVYIPPEAMRMIERSHRVLLVDDAVDSGTTLKQIINRIGEIQGERSVASAVITVTTAIPAVMPEFYLYNDSTLIRFPWAKDV